MSYIWQFYLLLAIILFQGILLAFISKRGQNVFLWLCFLELSFLAGFREWYIGNDTHHYVSTFIATINHMDISLSYMEKGYILYNQFIALFTSNPQAILLVTALIVTGSICYFIRKYSTVVLIPILLFVILQFGASMCIMRQYLAISIVLCSMSFVVKRQFIPFLLCCALATSVHYSATISLGLYFIYPLPFKIKYLFWCFVGTMLAFIFLAPLLDPIFTITGRYENYQGSILLGEETKIASIIKTTVQFVIAVFCCFSYRYVLRKDSICNVKLPPQFLLWCSIISFCLHFISIRGTVLERLALYYATFSIISISFFVRCYNPKIRPLIGMGLIGCFILYQSIIFIYRPTWNQILPFRFCF